MVTKEKYKEHMSNEEILVPDPDSFLGGFSKSQVFPESTFKMYDVYCNWEKYEEVFNNLSKYEWRKEHPEEQVKNQ